MDIKRWVADKIGLNNPLRLSSILLVDLCAANDNGGELEMYEVLRWYLEHQDHIVEIAHYLNVGYKNIPDDIQIIKILDTDEISFSYQRCWMKAIINIFGVTCTCELIWHKHDGCSIHCIDELWVYSA